MRGATRHQSNAGVQIYEAQYALLLFLLLLLLLLLMLLLHLRATLYTNLAFISDCCL